jgi:hypothetical protein
MHPSRRSSSIQRYALVGIVALAALLLAGCGAQDRVNPFAPVVESSHQSGALAQAAKSSKPKHNNGRGPGNLRTGNSSGSLPGGVTSGSFPDPGTEKPAEGLIID